MHTQGDQTASINQPSPLASPSRWLPIFSSRPLASSLCARRAAPSSPPAAVGWANSSGKARSGWYSQRRKQHVSSREAPAKEEEMSVGPCGGEEWLASVMCSSGVLTGSGGSGSGGDGDGGSYGGSVWRLRLPWMHMRTISH